MSVTELMSLGEFVRFFFPFYFIFFFWFFQQVANSHDMKTNMHIYTEIHFLNKIECFCIYLKAISTSFYFMIVFFVHFYFIIKACPTLRLLKSSLRISSSTQMVSLFVYKSFEHLVFILLQEVSYELVDSFTASFLVPTPLTEQSIFSTLVWYAFILY